MGRLGASWCVMGRPEGVLGASWGHLGGLAASWGRLGVLLGRLGGVLEASWAVWGASWGRSESFLGRLVSVLEASWGVLAAIFSHAILDAIFERIFVHSCLRISNSELWKIIKL